MATHEGPVPEPDPVEQAGGDYLSADQLLENAPADLEERDVEAFGGKLRIRSLTAHQAARVKQRAVILSGKNPDIAWAEMEKAQFQIGVVEPKLTDRQVDKLHRTSGASFAVVVQAIDEISGLDKEELRKAQQEFREADE